MLEIPISHGDLIDRITILSIKLERLSGPSQRNVQKEHDLLCARLAVDPQLEHQLLQVNQSLWEVEDALRDCEQRGSFTDEFIQLARQVYQLNDQRAALKRQINLQTGSGLIEVKSYGNADARPKSLRSSADEALMRPTMKPTNAPSAAPCNCQI